VELMSPFLHKSLIAYIAITVVVIFGLILFFDFQAKAQSASLPKAQAHYGDFQYEVIEIEGMPCVVAESGNYFGITCDWAKWQGE
jgi:hypothetical protein